MPAQFKGETVSACKLITSLEVGIVSAEHVKIYAENHDATLMDFNRAFSAYDTLEGVRCQTAMGSKSQLQAALDGVAQVGLNQTADIQAEWFDEPDQYDMLAKRLALLKERNEG